MSSFSKYKVKILSDKKALHLLIGGTVYFLIGTLKWWLYSLQYLRFNEIWYTHCSTYALDNEGETVLVFGFISWLSSALFSFS